MEHELYKELQEIKRIMQYQAEQLTKLVSIMEEELPEENDRIQEKE